MRRGDGRPLKRPGHNQGCSGKRLESGMGRFLKKRTVTVPEHLSEKGGVPARGHTMCGLRPRESPAPIRAKRPGVFLQVRIYSGARVSIGHAVSLLGFPPPRGAPTSHALPAKMEGLGHGRYRGLYPSLPYAGTYGKRRCFSPGSAPRPLERGMIDSQECRPYQ